MALTVGSVIERAARSAPSAIAATLGDDALTFGAFDADSNRLAHALSGFGIGYGDRVAWWSETSLEALSVFGALAKLGAVFMPINARLSEQEANAVVERAEPRLVLSGSLHDEIAREVARRSGLAHVDAPARARLAVGGSASQYSAPSLSERDPHVVFFTSGSTGAPKGVVLSHRANWLRSYPGATTEAGVRGGVVCMFPLFHMAGWSIALGAWQARRPVHFSPADASSLLETAASQHAARLYALPAVWARILDHGVARHDLSALREADTGTSATPPELIAAIKAALPASQTRVFYGSTEAGPATLLADLDLARKPGSVGLAQPGCEVCLRDGEICVTNDFLFDEYLRDSEATAAAFTDDGWYRTGDLGSFDDDGYLSVIGRARDVIRTGGETVAPSEVEDAIRSHPGVAEVAVVGLPDPEWGEIVTAAVVVAPGVGAVTIAELRDHCRHRLAAYKQPRRLVILDALPRTEATGQIQRPLIVERILAMP